MCDLQLRETVRHIPDLFDQPRFVDSHHLFAQRDTRFCQTKALQKYVCRQLLLADPAGDWNYRYYGAMHIRCIVADENNGSPTANHGTVFQRGKLRIPDLKTIECIHYSTS